MDHFTDRHLIEKLQNITWAIEVEFFPKEKGDRGNIFAKYGTAFAINIHNHSAGSSKKVDIVLMTCAHVLAVEETNCLMSIKARKMCEEGFNLEADVVEVNNNFDVALLVVNGANYDTYGEFPVDTSIRNAQTLLSVGHSSGSLAWSIFVGRAAYPCINDLIPLNLDETCSSFVCSSQNKTPSFRILGDYFNKAFFAESKTYNDECFKHLNPRIPIIQYANTAGSGGASGGPVCNHNGEILGMLIGSNVDGHEIVIHASFLKDFVRTNSKSCKMALKKAAHKELKKDAQKKKEELKKLKKDAQKKRRDGQKKLKRKHE